MSHEAAPGPGTHVSFCSQQVCQETKQLLRTSNLDALRELVLWRKKSESVFSNAFASNYLLSDWWKALLHRHADGMPSQLVVVKQEWFAKPTAGSLDNSCHVESCR